MEAGAAGNVVQLRQLSLDAGGATVDESVIGTFSFAAGMKDLDVEFKKGSDVRFTFVARVTGVDTEDKYDGHGNIARTIRGHDFRVDQVELAELVNPRAYKTAAEAAAEEDAAGDGDEGALGGAEPVDDDGDPDPDAQAAADAEAERAAEEDAAPAAESEPEPDPFAGEPPAGA